MCLKVKKQVMYVDMHLIFFKENIFQNNHFLKLEIHLSQKSPIYDNILKKYVWTNYKAYI